MIITKYFHAESTKNVDSIINDYLVDGWFVTVSNLSFIHGATIDYKDKILVYGIITFEKP